MSNPKISVIVPVYNAESTIRRCVDSILAQTYTDFECLLIDDGGKDKSGEICDDYAAKDGRVRVFHKENGGVSSARNVGLDNANGEWITFCDSDDFVSDSWLQNMVELCYGKELVIQGFYPSIPGKFKTAGKFTDCELPVAAALSYLNECCALGYVWNKLFKMKHISENNLRFPTEIQFKEDEIFTLEYCDYINTVTISHKRAYYYRVPNYQRKYQGVDEFEIYYRLYVIGQNIKWEKGDSLINELFSGLTSSLFSSYKNNVAVDESKLKRYKSICGNRLLLLPNISLLTKFVYILPTKLAHRILMLKGKL